MRREGGRAEGRRHGVGNIRQEIRFVLERDVRILGIAAEPAVEPVPAAKLQGVLAHMMRKLLLEAIGLAIHVPNLGAVGAESGGARDAQASQTAAPLQPFRDVSGIFPQKILIQTGHGAVVKPEAAFRGPTGRADCIIPGEAVLRIVIGPVIRWINRGVEPEGTHAGIGNPKVA